MPLDRARGPGIRLRLVERLGGQGHDAARGPRRDRGELRAHPSLQPGRHGRAAAAVPRGRDRSNRSASPDASRSTSSVLPTASGRASWSRCAPPTDDGRTRTFQAISRLTARSRWATTARAGSCRQSCGDWQRTGPDTGAGIALRRADAHCSEHQRQMCLCGWRSGNAPTGSFPSLLVGVVAAIAAPAAAPPASAVAAGCEPWYGTQPSGASSATGVAVLSPCNAWLVAADAGSGPVAEQWNGIRWTSKMMEVPTAPTALCCSRFLRSARATSGRWERLLPGAR